jgi:hypothetical protein
MKISIRPALETEAGKLIKLLLPPKDIGSILRRGLSYGLMN